VRHNGTAAFHGFGLAQTMRERAGSRRLTGHGTLYKALRRLEEFGTRPLAPRPA
jgi:DNA-binding PadR family transcriptional regulator